MKNAIAFLVITLFIITNLFAQDARLTQYEKLPLMMSPSLIGNFDGSSRIIGYYNYATDDNLSNNVFNLSADFKTKKKSLSLGFNYMKTGSENFAVSGDYFAFGFSKSYFIDKNHLHKLRIGNEITFLNPVYAKNKKGYNAYLDPRAFPFTKTSRVPDSLKYSNQYWGLNVGGSYTYNFNRICFEANASMYNLLWFTQKKDIARKRRRLMTNLSFKYALNKYSDLKLEQLTWQEGHFFDSDQEIILADSIGIKDVVYGFMYENSNKIPYNIGLRSRSVKAFSLIFGIQIFKNIHTQLSYELPLRKDLDNPTQMGISFIYIDKKKKRSVDLPAVASFGDSVFLNENDFTKVVNVHDTIFVYKNDTVLVYTNHDTENENVVKNNPDFKNDVVQKPAIKNEAVLNDSSRSSSKSNLNKNKQVDIIHEDKSMNDSIFISSSDKLIVSNTHDSIIKDNVHDSILIVHQLPIENKSVADTFKNINTEKSNVINGNESQIKNQDTAFIVQHEQPKNNATLKVNEIKAEVLDYKNSQQQNGISNKVSNAQIEMTKTQKDSSKKSIQLVANKFTIEKRELTNVYFDFNKSSLSDSSKLIIDQFISTQKIKPGVKLLVEGFCDDVGTESHNLKLSKSRAVSVKKYLIAKGIDKKIISLIHFGKTFKTLSDADRWKYRKSVIVLID
jgi:outer membrane protein OmpA-like peptidoglycan-associated protein